MLLALTMLGSVIAALAEYRQLKEQHHNRDIAISASLLCMGLALIILQLLHVKLPSPMTGITNLFGPLAKLVERLLSS